jgi:hypothetical protein
MAEIKMGRFEIAEYELPDVCLKCGAPARERLFHTFTWTPGWVYAFFMLGPIGIFVIRILINSVRQEFTMGVPLCAEHRGHWFRRNLIVVLLVGSFVAALIGGGVLAGELEEPLAFVITFFSALFSVILAVILVQRTAIRAREITHQSITLTGVSDEFVAAINEDRRGERDRDEDEADDERRSSRRSRREREEDERQPRKRRHVLKDETSRPKTRDRSEGISDPTKPRRTRGDSDAIQSGDK